ncbi:MAG: zinc ribbon domain-containing protein [Lachnospiraceae bacterium]|nr:zinc ribbon domain-containing protein [Lachnospiraceae bacterium]
MNCSNCGKEIMEGATYCLECGASIDEPVVLKDLKPKNVEEAKASGTIKEKKNFIETMKDDFAKCMSYKGPKFDFSGYIKSIGTETNVLIGLLAAILVYMAPFFSWIWSEHFRVKKTSNLFELGGKNGEFSVNSGILIFMGILIMLCAIDMLAFSGCKYIGPLKAFEKNYVIKALPIVLSLIFFIIVINNNKYDAALEFIKNQEETAQKLGSGTNYAGGMGVGPILLISGQVLYVVSLFMDYTKREK